MRAGQKDRWRALQLFILLILSTELEVRGQEDECAALHHPGGTSGWEVPDRMKNPAEPSLMTDQLFLHNHEALSFWGHLEGQTKDQAEPVSWSQRAQRAADPVPQFDHQQILMLQEDHVVQSAAAHLYDQHPALSSVHLLDQNQRPKRVKGPAVPLSENSSLVLVGHGARDGSGQMRVSGLTCGDVARIIQSCSGTGTAPRIRTTTLVACDVGSDEEFLEDLLKKLHEAGVQTQLHLWTTLVQVTETGKIISQDLSPDGPEWRHEDPTKKVVLTVGRNGELTRTTRTRTQSSWRGERLFTNSTNFLGKSRNNRRENQNNQVIKLNLNRNRSLQQVLTNNRKKRDVDPRFLKYRTSWPAAPKTFIDADIYKTETEENKQNLKELEALSWGLFYSDQPKPGKVNVNNLKENDFIIRDRNQNKWINDVNKQKPILQKCYEMKSGKDIRNIIRHFAKDGEDETTYLMVNDWLYEINPQSLYVYPVGKKLDNNEKDQSVIDRIKQSIVAQKGKESYPNIKEGMRKSVENTGKNYEEIYAEYTRKLFLGQHAFIPVEAESWFTTYFVASVIAESSRNFRTFPLILMALHMTENSDQNVQTKGQNSLFDQHPMTRGGTWIDPSRRGFTGSATPEGSSKLENKVPKTKEELMEDLRKVIKHEAEIFRAWKLKTVPAGQTCVGQMATIAARYQTIDDEEKFKKDYNEYKNKINQQPNQLYSQSLQYKQENSV